MTKFYKFNKRLPKPSVTEGVAKMVDFRSLREKYAKLLENNADYNAILSDWVSVGQDIRDSIEIAKKELPENNNV